MTNNEWVKNGDKEIILHDAMLDTLPRICHATGIFIIASSLQTLCGFYFIRNAASSMVDD